MWVWTLLWTTEAAAYSQGLLPPLAEPSTAEYFGFSAGGVIAVERIRNITPADFDSRVRAGRPFIIEDAGHEHPFLGVTCEEFHNRFPGAKMRAEYTGGERERFISLGGKSWFKKDRLKAPQADHLSQGSTKLNAPYVWHVKDGGHEAPPAIKAAVQSAWREPYFIRGATNRREANESTEFWFSRRKGAVLAHADTYCIPAVSLQLLGTKKWRLMPPPPIPSLLDRYDSHDGGIYTAGLWQPTYEATVQEGEAIILFPNTFHETFIPEENPECTVATTFQFQLPVPVRYLRAFLPTHVMSHLYYEEHCKDLWHSFATMRPPHAVKPTLNETIIAQQVTSLFAAADISPTDARLSLAELMAYLAAEQPPWPRWFFTDDYFYDFRPDPQEQEVMSQEVLQNRAEDTLHYHDVNNDGFISESEFLVSLRQWHVTHEKLRVTENLQKRNPDKKGWKSVQKTEATYLKQYVAKRGEEHLSHRAATAEL